MADSAIAQLHATALTARCHNAFFRQKQLKSLHDGLRQDSNTLKDALKADTHISDVEATVEVAAALELVKEHHASIDPAKELESEYRVANGKDAGDQTKPWGVVYIEPQQNHTPLFSAIAALSAALAAGNCVALKVKCPLDLLLSTLTNHSSRTTYVSCRHYCAPFFRKPLNQTPSPSCRPPHHKKRSQPLFKFSRKPRFISQTTTSSFLLKPR